MSGTLAASGLAYGGPTLSNDFETADTMFDPLFSYFGGVQSFGTSASSVSVYSGGSMRVWANFRPDPVFHSAGVGVGVFEVARPALAVPAGANVLSLAIRTPPTAGRFTLKMNFIEDDDGDGVLDAVDADDQWEIPGTVLAPGSTVVVNVPFAQLIDANPGVGNDAISIASVQRCSLTLTLETRTSNPGGIVQVPVEFFVDHVGFFVGDQVIPQVCRADIDGSNTLTVQDVFMFLAAWFGGEPNADMNNSGTLTVDDVFAFLGLWFAGCG